MPSSCAWFPLGDDEIQQWVERHRAELPQTLEKLALLPIPFRKAVFRAVPADIRVNLWREHLASFLTSPSSWSREQKTLLMEAISEMPAIVGADAERGRQTGRDLKARLSELFTTEQALLMFGTLGPPEPPEGLPIPNDAFPHPPE